MKYRGKDSDLGIDRKKEFLIPSLYIRSEDGTHLQSEEWNDEAILH